jgi:pimeloyl-ACP methyl ester carboxylesterase
VTARRELLVPSGDDLVGVEVCGSGPAVVLLHGSGGNRATWFQQVVDLARECTVVVVEARGCGRSTDVHDASGPVSGAVDLEAVRQHLGLDQWHVVGHSLGGWTALRYATEHPERCLSVVLLSSLAGVFPPEADAHWTRLTADLAAKGWPDQQLGRPPALTDAFCDGHPELGYLYQLVRSLNPPPSMTAPAVRIREHDLAPEQLALLTMPVTFLTGSADEIAPWDVVSVAAATCGATAQLLDGVGHLALWEQPALVTAVLRAQLLRYSATSPAS